MCNKELHRQLTNRNTAIKTSLKAVGTKMELPFNLTMHLARHSFAVMALNQRNVSLHIISKLLGHSSIMVTEKVYAKFLPDTLDKEVKEKLSFINFEINSYTLGIPALTQFFQKHLYCIGAGVVFSRQSY